MVANSILQNSEKPYERLGCLSESRVLSFFISPKPLPEKNPPITVKLECQSKREYIVSNVSRFLSSLAIIDYYIVILQIYGNDDRLSDLPVFRQDR